MAKMTRYNRSLKRKFRRTDHNWRSSNRQTSQQNENNIIGNDLNVKRRSHNNPTGKLTHNVSKKPSKTINILIAKTNDGVPTLHYDRYKVFDSILKQLNFKIDNPKLLMKILTVAEDWIGSHVESLQDYILETREGHDEYDRPYDWPI